MRTATPSCSPRRPKGPVCSESGVRRSCGSGGRRALAHSPRELTHRHVPCCATKGLLLIAQHLADAGMKEALDRSPELARPGIAAYGVANVRYVYLSWFPSRRVPEPIALAHHAREETSGDEGVQRRLEGQRI